MTLPADEKNRKLKATPASQPFAAHQALNKLKRKAQTASVFRKATAPEIPDGSGKISKHLQGIGMQDKQLFLSSSAEGGKIIRAAETAPGEYEMTSAPTGFTRSVHPGGIQCIGRYLCVPVYGGNYSAIEFLDTQSNMDSVRTLRLSRNCYCVGITTSTDKDGEYYVVTAITQNDGTRVEVYRSPSEARLTDANCTFQLGWSYKAPAEVNDPLREWNGYPNNCALVSDTKGNVFFLGLYKTKITGGRDFADLYHLDFTLPEDEMFQRLTRFHAKCSSAPAFRWGAGVRVVNGQEIEITACPHHAQKNNRRIRIDRFTA